jgi:hypothetical protein
MSLTFEQKAFRGARAKVKRAYQHIAEFEKLINTYREVGGYFISIEKNPETGNLHLINSPGDLSLLAGMAPIVGDVIHNLRAALDYIAYQIILAATGKADETIYFPIDNNRNSLIGKSEFAAIKSAAPDLAEIIVKVQEPYGAGNKLVPLNKLDRMDKHRLLPMVSVSHNWQLTVIQNDDNPPPYSPGTLWIRGDPIGLVRPKSRADLDNQRNRKAMVDIVFGQGTPFHKESTVPTLHQLSQVVAGVIRAFEVACFGEDYRHSDAPRFRRDVSVSYIPPADSPEQSLDSE